MRRSLSRTSSLRGKRCCIRWIARTGSRGERGTSSCLGRLRARVAEPAQQNNGTSGPIPIRFLRKLDPFIWYSQDYVFNCSSGCPIPTSTFNCDNCRHGCRFHPAGSIQPCLTGANRLECHDMVLSVPDGMADVAGEPCQGQIDRRAGGQERGGYFGDHVDCRAGESCGNRPGAFNRKGATLRQPNDALCIYRLNRIRLLVPSRNLVHISLRARLLPVSCRQPSAEISE